MAYIRTKIINNQKYAYLVESKAAFSGPRQKVEQYLGRIYDLEKNNLHSDENVINKKPILSGKNILLNLTLDELQQHGFVKKKDNYVYDKLIFSPQHFSLSKKNKSSLKEAVIALNDGYLCSFTLQRIANFKKTKDFSKDAYSLAKYFLEAGLQISQEDFVKFYQQL